MPSAPKTGLSSLPTRSSGRGATPPRPVLAVTLGDPGGIGPEVALKAWADEAIRQQARLVMVGSAAVLRAHAQALGPEALGRALPAVDVVQSVPATLPDDAVCVLDVAETDAPAEVSFGEGTAAGGRLSMRAVERAVDACRAGTADAMVTAPISKAAIGRAGYRAPGHTEFIAARVSDAGASFEPLMLMVGEPAGTQQPLRVGLVSVHEPLRAAPASVTAEAIRRKLRILATSLRRDFGVEAPRIAVLGLNPHAGDSGALGAEEQDIIAPALAAARGEDGLADAGVEIDGPFPADGFFGTRGWARCDAVLAMYHDQGLAPFKALTFGGGVNMTAGLPIVRTSPDHGTAYDIAGTGRADPGSMKNALFLAAGVAKARRRAASRTTGA